MNKRDLTRDECRGGLDSAVLRGVRTALDSNPKTAGTILEPWVSQMDLPEYFPNCFLLSLGDDKAGYGVYWNTGVGTEPPTEDRTIQRAVCKA